VGVAEEGEKGRLRLRYEVHAVLPPHLAQRHAFVQGGDSHERVAVSLEHFHFDLPRCLEVVDRGGEFSLLLAYPSQVVLQYARPNIRLAEIEGEGLFGLCILRYGRRSLAESEVLHAHA